MNEIDLRILRAIQHDPEISIRDLAGKIGISHTPCWKRVERLKKIGVINFKGYSINRKEVGYDIDVVCFIKINSHRKENLQEFENSIMKIPEIVRCNSITGEYDYVLYIIAKSIPHYESIIKHSLSELPHVGSIATSVSLKEIKFSSYIPI